MAGGRYLYNSNDLTTGFKQTATDMRGSYTLGFYMPDDPDNKWHKLKVRVKRTGVNIRHREGYLADNGPTQAVEWTAEMWRAAIGNPMGSTVIPLTAKCELTTGGELALTLFVDANSLQFRQDGENLKANLEIAILDRAADASGRFNRSAFTASVPAAKWEVARKQGVSYRRQWKTAADVTSLRVIVHDVRSGQYGTLEVPLNKLPR